MPGSTPLPGACHRWVSSPELVWLTADFSFENLTQINQWEFGSRLCESAIFCYYVMVAKGIRTYGLTNNGKWPTTFKVLCWLSRGQGKTAQEKRAVWETSVVNISLRVSANQHAAGVCVSCVKRRRGLRRCWLGCSQEARGQRAWISSLYRNVCGVSVRMLVTQDWAMPMPFCSRWTLCDNKEAKHSRQSGIPACTVCENFPSHHRGPPCHHHPLGDHSSSDFLAI